MKGKLLAALSAAFGIAALANGPEARASSLDGAGRIVVLPYAVSGLVRESTIYVTNPSLREIRVFSMYVGAEGTPLAASAHGLTPCKEIQVRPGETSVIPLRTLCGLGTPDVENFGYVQFATYFGFDGAPFLVSSTIDAGSSSLFGVEGVPAGAIEPSQSALVRQDALRVVGLTGEVPERHDDRREAGALLHRRTRRTEESHGAAHGVQQRHREAAWRSDPGIPGGVHDGQARQCLRPRRPAAGRASPTSPRNSGPTRWGTDSRPPPTVRRS